jgi:cytoskeletal protein CcmA (bactofilin family)
MARNRRVELSTIIGAGSEITGDLVLDGGVRIDGTIRGSIISTGIVAIGVTGVSCGWTCNRKDCGAGRNRAG